MNRIIVLAVDSTTCFNTLHEMQGDASGIGSRLCTPLLTGGMPDFFETMGLLAYGITVESVATAGSSAPTDDVLPSFAWTCADGYNHVLATPFGDVTVQAMGDGAGYAEPPWTPDAWIREPSVDAAKLAVQLDLLGRARSVVAGMAARGREWVKADG